MNHPHPLVKTQLSVLTGLVLVGLCAPWYPGPARASADATSAVVPASPGAVAISEILPNAVNESTGELIEVVNTGSAAIDLTGWKFADASLVQQTLAPFTKTLPFGTSGMTLQPGQVALILDKDYASEYNTEILLSDTSGSILLLTTSTGNLNLANTTESVSVIGASGTTSDTFAWSTDPGSEVTFSRMSTDSGWTELALADHRTLGWVELEPAPLPAPQVLLSELLPSPTNGEEFIELYNPASTAADLGTISLRDASAKTHVLTGSLTPKSYAVLYKSTTGISLNNDGDTIELLWTSTETSVLDTVAYASAPDDQTWARFEDSSDEFAWTTEPTPGEPNVLVEPPTDDPDPDPTDPSDDNLDDEEESDDDELDQDETTEESVTISSLADLSAQEDGTIVTINGTVTAKAGTFYLRTLHIGDAKGSALVKVDSDTQAIVGNVLVATGKLETYAKQKRVVAQKTTVRGTSDISYLKVTPGQLTEEHVGRAVQLSGIVTRRSGKSFRVGPEKSEEAEKSDTEKDTLVSIRKSTGITTTAPKKGSAVTITGLVLRSGEQLVVAPRGTADLTGDKTNGGTTKATALPKSGADPITLTLLAGLSALVLTVAWHAGRPAVHRVARLGRSKSSPDLVVR